MAAKASTYTSGSSVDSLAAINAKLVADVRATIKSLALVSPLSPEWQEMARKMARLARITETERGFVKEKSDGTLWDGEEHTLRFLLEDGKINLCLRLIDEYQAYLAALEASGHILPPHETAICSQFEFGVGTTLANAWLHKEAVQTCELPLLAKVFALCLARAALRARSASAGSEPVPSAADAAGAGGGTGGLLAEPAADAERVEPRTLDSLCLRFMLGLSKAAVGTHERRIVAELQKAGVFDAYVRHLSAHHATLHPADVAAGIEGLSAMVATEEFGALKAKLVLSSPFLDALASLGPAVLDRLCTDPPTKRKLRPLLDWSLEAQRRRR